MPAALIIFVIVRIYRAFAATINLLTDLALLRTLPWRYILRLPLRHAWIAIAAGSLVITLATAALGLALPSEGARDAALNLGWRAAVVGLVSSWVRAVVMWFRLRRR